MITQKLWTIQPGETFEDTAKKKKKEKRKRKEKKKKRKMKKKEKTIFVYSSNQELEYPAADHMTNIHM
jgi:hypothetical protein